MYDVALLFERQLTDLDADQVVALHEGLDDTVRYHLLLPVETSASMLASSMSALGGGQIMIADADTITDVQNELSAAGQAELDASAALLTSRGQEVTKALTEDDPDRSAQRAGGHDVIVRGDHPHRVAHRARVPARGLDVPREAQARRADRPPARARAVRTRQAH